MHRFSPFFLVCIAGLLAACGGGSSSTAPATEPTGPRIVSTVPAATMNLVLIGGADRLVGVSKYDIDGGYLPLGMRELPVVGDYSTMNYEQLAKLKPTALIIQTAPARIDQRLKDFVAEHHIDLVNMRFENIEDIWTSTRALGKAAECEKDAERAVTDAQAELRAVEDAYKDKPHPKVVYLVNSAMIAGGRTFFDEMVIAAGAEDVGTKVGDGYLEITKETIVKLAPEVLLVCSTEDAGMADGERELKPWRELAIPAAKNSRIYLLADKTSLMASVDVGKNVKELAEMIHKGDAAAGAGGGKP